MAVSKEDFEVEKLDISKDLDSLIKDINFTKTMQCNSSLNNSKSNGSNDTRNSSSNTINQGEAKKISIFYIKGNMLNPLLFNIKKNSSAKRQDSYKTWNK